MKNIRNTLPLGVLIILGIFIFAAGIFMHYTFIDEVMFCDPVINYLQGNGYSTTAWKVTGQYQTHVSTAPVYSFLLLLWFKCFGIWGSVMMPLFVERSLPVVLALASVFVFWRACLRAGLIKSALGGALLISMTLLNYGYSFSYTCGRPDSLSALVLASIFYASTLQNQRAGLLIAGILSFLIPFCQWACVIFVVLLSVSLFFILEKKYIPFIVVVCVGMAAGLLAQKIVYAHFGLWDIWIATVRSEGSENILQRIVSRLGRNIVKESSNIIPKDFSSIFILMGTAVLYVYAKCARKRTGVALSRSSFIIAFVVLAGMYFIAKFPTYYSWMIGFPLSAIFCAYFDTVIPCNLVEKTVGVITAILAIGSGLPLQAALASYDWNDRKPTEINAWLESKIGPNDVVYCDYPFYFMLKPRIKQLYVGQYSRRLTSEEARSITVAVISSCSSEWKNIRDTLVPDETSEWKSFRPSILGNDYRYGILSAPNYDCVLYRIKR